MRTVSTATSTYWLHSYTAPLPFGPIVSSIVAPDILHPFLFVAPSTHPSTCSLFAAPPRYCYATLLAVPSATHVATSKSAHSTRSARTLLSSVALEAAKMQSRT